MIETLVSSVTPYVKYGYFVLHQIHLMISET